MPKKLYRSRNNKMLTGACAGIAEYFNIDTTIVRLIWVVLSLSGGAGILGYVICSIIVPENPLGC